MTQTDAVKDLGLKDGDLSFSCEAFIFGKMHRTPFSTKGHEKATEVCELVHGDVGGPTHISTFDDYKYYSLLHYVTITPTTPTSNSLGRGIKLWITSWSSMSG